MRRVLTHQALEVNPDVRLELVERICSTPFGRGGGGAAATAKRKVNYLWERAFSPRGIFFGHRLVAAP